MGNTTTGALLHVYPEMSGHQNFKFAFSDILLCEFSRERTLEEDKI